MSRRFAVKLKEDGDNSSGIDTHDEFKPNKDPDHMLDIMTACTRTKRSMSLKKNQPRVIGVKVEKKNLR